MKKAGFVFSSAMAFLSAVVILAYTCLTINDIPVKPESWVLIIAAEVLWIWLAYRAYKDINKEE